MTRKSLEAGALRSALTQRRRRKANLPVVRVKRLPQKEEFFWMLYTQLYAGLSQAEILSEEASSVFRDLLRKKDVAGMKGLELSWLLQSNQLDGAAVAEIAAKLLLGRLLVKLPGSNESELKDKCLRDVMSLDAGLYAPALSEPDDPIVESTRRWVGRILGTVPDIDELNVEARHGPGSTARTSYTFRDPYYKYSSWPYAVTRGCKGLFKQLILNDARWMGALEQSYRQRFGINAWEILDWNAFWQTVLMEQDCNVVTAVPKDRFKMRPIAKEPLGNVYCQLAIGSIMKKRLLLWGVDLTDQTRNQQLARLGSQDPGPLSPCTFDLSNASDTISTAVCEALLPPWWFCLLESVRSPYGEWPTQCWRYAKMSSMGNGTTFELESTIFYAVIRAVIDHCGDASDVPMTSVFGDDLVFPRYLAPVVLRYLQAFGFTVNVDKSFSAGPFMESCGKDWYRGYNVRPVYCKDRVLDLPELLSLRNRLHRWYRERLGCYLPKAVDDVFATYVEGWELLDGPEDDDCMDRWVHRPPRGGRWPKVWYSVVRNSQDFPAREFWFGKLKHTLKTCDSDSDASHFAVAGKSIGWSIRREALNSSRDYGYVDDDGHLQDHAGPAFEEIGRRPSHP